MTRLYKAQYVTRPDEDFGDVAEWPDEYSEPEGWAEYCQDKWGKHVDFFMPSDRQIYRSRSSAQTRVNLINRWGGEGAAVLVECEPQWVQTSTANRQRKAERLRRRYSELAEQVDDIAHELAALDGVAAGAEKLEKDSLFVSGSFLVQQDSINASAENEHSASLVSVEREQRGPTGAGGDESSELVHQGFKVAVGKLVFASAVDETCSHYGAPSIDPVGGVDGVGAPNPTHGLPLGGRH